ncbi:trypsin-like peptidase domain-containing protein [Rudanella lutea]|uniref:trypsin-like peptidase domain-containing protein n=1 Tax=Rudanella lutea TaxID=451374 RepID=UPI00037C4575|nr:trypsin-like peptidase domain-containing protein [Rudanella lutea]
MFVDAIERVEPFTRPLQSIIRLYGHSEVVPGSATLFFVNEDGCAITCKHVAELIVRADDIYKHYLNFQSDRRKLPRDRHYSEHLRLLEDRYKLQAESIVRLRNNFHGCVDRMQKIHIDMHPVYDLALIRFEGYTQTLYQSHAVFARDTSYIKPGRSLCRLGFPFPDFTNFRYNAQLDDIEWTESGRAESVRFPIDGIVTRLIADPDGTISGVEMSTPGLRGQSGGPLFDVRGLICGMQSATRHLHLGFDIEDREVLVNNRKTKVSNYPFLNVGLCVHADVIKRFLRDKGVRFYEA